MFLPIAVDRFRRNLFEPFLGAPRWLDPGTVISGPVHRLVPLSGELPDAIASHIISVGQTEPVGESLEGADDAVGSRAAPRLFCLPKALTNS